MMERKRSSVGAVYDRASFPLMSEKRAVIDRAYRRTPWLLLLLLSISAAAQQQQTPFTLKVSTQLVIQAVTVTDKDGKTLSGLTAEDFTLTEDNNPQTISVFEFQKIDDTATPRPLSTPPQQFAAALQPAITKITPVPDGDDRYQDRRLLALYFDMSALNEIDRYRALTAAQAFIEKEMKGPDLVALFTYGNGSVRVRRDFTDDRAALEESLQRLLNPKDTDALEDTVADFGQNGGEFNLFNTDRQLAALQTAVNMLGVLKEKKSLIYFASGLNL
ncbi:MAG TPA: VWA domain-containing protein, partial [Terriglobia bacterium]|nr:VWA domain-containing protein [Terriglobia bacterium]